MTPEFMTPGFQDIYITPNTEGKKQDTYIQESGSPFSALVWSH